MSVVYFCQLTPVYREREELSIPYRQGYIPYSVNQRSKFYVFAREPIG